MHPLDGAHLKLARAQSQISTIKGIETAFFKETKHSIVRAEFNSETGKHVYRIKIDGSPPSPEWGVFIGEIAHDLRCALNYLIYQLALLNTANTPETVAGDRILQFPIFTDINDFRRKGERQIRLLTTSHKTIIEGLQPYNGDSTISLPVFDLAKWSNRNNPLFWLEEINNIDKHRIIHVAGVNPSVIGFAYTGKWNIRDHIDIPSIFGILEDGAYLFELPPEIKVNTNIMPLIAFAQTLGLPPELKRKPVCITFDLIYQLVYEIIELFEVMFV